VDIVMRPIGTIHSPFAEKEDTPIQGAFEPDALGQVEVFEEFEEGLKDIEGFSHLMLLYHFDRAGNVKLARPTFLDDVPHGVFACRHPCRPNGIGLSVVRLLRREGRILHMAEIDVLDGTPLLDIKPYVPRFDCRPDATSGWIEGKERRPKPAGRE
jgi:tRNA (adenine37-N6)-methyltransferase